MRRVPYRWPMWLFLGILALAVGCKGEDADRLAKVGRDLRAKIQGQKGDKLSEQLRADLEAMSVDARIAARIRWDKTLRGAKIEVIAKGSEVELHGNVPDAAQRKRAVEIAQSTAGADKVTDAMEPAEKKTEQKN